MIDENKQIGSSNLSLALAGGFLNRIRGLFKFSGRCGCLLITPCHSVHTFGFDKPVDVAFVDQWGTIMKVDRLEPWRICSCRGAEGVIERICPDNEVPREWFEVGERVVLSSSSWHLGRMQRSFLLGKADASSRSVGSGLCLCPYVVDGK